MNNMIFASRTGNGLWLIMQDWPFFSRRRQSLFLSGLSLRSLWGSEGRWAVVAREMMQTGNYFLPTINGQVYFDKPLLSYWAIIPFSWFTGVTETSARLPGALAGLSPWD